MVAICLPVLISSSAGPPHQQTSFAFAAHGDRARRKEETGVGPERNYGCSLSPRRELEEVGNCRLLLPGDVIPLFLHQQIGERVGRDTMGDQAEKYGQHNHHRDEFAARDPLVQDNYGEDDTRQSPGAEPAKK